MDQISPLILWNIWLYFGVHSPFLCVFWRDWQPEKRTNLIRSSTDWQAVVNFQNVSRITMKLTWLFNIAQRIRIHKSCSPSQSQYEFCSVLFVLHREKKVSQRTSHFPVLLENSACFWHFHEVAWRKETDKKRKFEVSRALSHFRHIYFNICIVRRNE